MGFLWSLKKALSCRAIGIGGWYSLLQFSLPLPCHKWPKSQALLYQLYVPFLPHTLAFDSIHTCESHLSKSAVVLRWALILWFLCPQPLLYSVCLANSCWLFSCPLYWSCILVASFPGPGSPAFWLWSVSRYPLNFSTFCSTLEFHSDTHELSQNSGTVSDSQMTVSTHLSHNTTYTGQQRRHGSSALKIALDKSHFLFLLSMNSLLENRDKKTHL